ncbi:uncharacterized protein BYT42DRAFT_138027 [Radiomyces spectabilis]|uniref:uncharacterized protein n=1 Tax=Radiomyces spectabilis TaxID=64574 RepID=UPI002220CBE6|nr:uncharacterized protein BYT42DRAFT_138027 [Radiomyces spectabilis]KAI8366645.1 hypothetical protein BYT42DRAFT_138027 [Radiomyces spectabilis]
MWLDNSGYEQLGQQQKHYPSESTGRLDYYTEEDDETTVTGGTMSTLLDQDNAYLPALSPSNETPLPIVAFQEEMENLNDSRISRYQNTYFMDGGSRFISLPTLGNTNTKTASHISRVFEDWLQNKLYNQSNDGLDRLPILEDSAELVAEDILNKLKSRMSLRGLLGLDKIYIKVRTGHVYTYRQLENGQPMITEDMEGFFQQFPLFVEIAISTMARNTNDRTANVSYDGDLTVQLLLSFENMTINAGDPYKIMEDVQLSA